MLMSCVVGLALVEFGSRLLLLKKGAYQSQFRVVAAPYGVYDRKVGVSYLPDTAFSPVVVTDGAVTACMGEVSRANRDGLRGRTTLNEYARAAVRIAVIGDSFSHWRREGLTWPDLFQDRLAQSLGRSVAVLNYGAGGYGVLQMIDLAVEVAEQQRPDAIVIAFITDDLTRARWWNRIETIDGVVRPMILPEAEGVDLAQARDQYLVHPAATDAWCRAQLGQPPTPELTAIVAQYRLVHDALWRAHGRRPPSFWDLHGSVVFNKITTGVAIDPLMYSLPRIRFSSFMEDARFAADVARLRVSGVHIVLVHLPNAAELAAGRLSLSRTESALWRSLEEGLGTAVRVTSGVVAPEAVPAGLSLLPLDPHPSPAGLRFYGEQVAERFLEQPRGQAK
ncbi:MAG: SGNH/GDSL hydrolase family protein [Propionivibrio sp.]|uniref:SGNH/GDSL hydrolase family protein n=1 Tax=Propionivibrio sp. TaxID=2212460 RepID=UPI001A4C3E40|nr:SGNH/GDSL hydrolase family protein [Propionivibrio sp.]MBL8414920.1 SGNH/GDSL hydrolase family protein [Propionivibrio sp.]